MVAPEGVPCRRLRMGVLRPLAQPLADLVHDERVRQPREGAQLPRASAVAPARLRPLEQVLDRQKASGTQCSPRVRTSRTWASPSAASHHEQADRRGSSTGAPGSHQAPRIAHGTTCSSRQNTARRPPAARRRGSRRRPRRPPRTTCSDRSHDALGSTNRRSAAASTSGSPSRAAIVKGSSASRVAKSAVATLRPPNARARSSTARARFATAPSGASSSPVSGSIDSVVGGAGRMSGSARGAASTRAPAAISNVRPASVSSSAPPGAQSSIVAAPCRRPRAARRAGRRTARRTHALSPPPRRGG